MSERVRIARDAIQDHIESGRWTLVEQPCLCHGWQPAADVELSTVDRYGISHRLVVCRCCGLMRANPRLSDASLRDFYKSYYSALQGRDPGSASVAWAQAVRRGEDIAAYIESQLNGRTGDCILEIGCGHGGNLYPWQVRGCRCIGYDVADAVLDFGRAATGLDLRTGGVEEAVRAREQCDLLILSHVLEHFGDPLVELRKLRSLLKPGGLIYIELPGLFTMGMGAEYKVDPLYHFRLEHIWTFSLEGLTMVASFAGFDLVAGDEWIKFVGRVCPGGMASTVARPDPALHRKVIEHFERLEALRRSRSLHLWWKFEAWEWVRRVVKQVPGGNNVLRLLRPDVRGN